MRVSEGYQPFTAPEHLKPVRRPHLSENNLITLRRKRNESLLSAERARELLTYNKRTGVLRWRVQVSNVTAGTEAGYCRSGYRLIKTSGKMYYAHRVIWLIVTGTWPALEIDHRDHTGDNNRWRNLREATRLDNNRNTSKGKRNTSGVVGVYWCKRGSRWTAAIKINGKQIHLGRFTNKKAAIAARREAEKKYGFHKNHGK